MTLETQPAGPWQSSEPDMHAVTKLVEDHFYLAWQATDAIAMHPRYVDHAFSSAMLGLHEAAKGYDPSRETEFASFAMPRMRMRIKDGYRELTNWDRRRKEPREPSEFPNIARLDEPTVLDPDVMRKDLLFDEDPTAEDIITENLPSQPRHERLTAELLGLLSSRQQEVLQAYADGNTNREIGARLGVTEARAGQIRREALVIIHAAIGDKTYEECLDEAA